MAKKKKAKSDFKKSAARPSSVKKAAKIIYASPVQLTAANPSKR